MAYISGEWELKDILIAENLNNIKVEGLVVIDTRPYNKISFYIDAITKKVV
jgi:hypothetical protein